MWMLENEDTGITGNEAFAEFKYLKNNQLYSKKIRTLMVSPKTTILHVFHWICKFPLL